MQSRLALTLFKQLKIQRLSENFAQITRDYPDDRSTSQQAQRNSLHSDIQKSMNEFMEESNTVAEALRVQEARVSEAEEKVREQTEVLRLREATMKETEGKIKKREDELRKIKEEQKTRENDFEKMPQEMLGRVGTEQTEDRKL